MRFIFIFFLILKFKIIFCQNLIHNPDFENYKKNFIFRVDERDFDNFSGEGKNKIFKIDSFVNDWTALIGDPQYNNNTLRSIWGAYNGKRYDTIPPSFRNKGSIWWFTSIQTYDTINKIIDTFYNPLRNRFELLGMTFQGIYQKLKTPLIKDSTYIISIRHKTGSEYRNGNNYFAAMVSNIAVSATTYNASKPLVTQFSFDNLNLILDDNELDTNYKWRLLKSKFKADSFYQFINIFRYQDALNTKFKYFICPICEVVGYNFYGQKGFVYHSPIFIDDIRLLPEWQYIDVPNEIEACEGDSIILNVYNGTGPYSWVRSDNPTNILSTNKEIKIKVSDSNLMYQVMSPYDTAVIPIYIKKQKFYKDTISVTNCENNPLKISNAKIVLWNDNQKDTIRYIDKAGFYWYETKNNCEIHRTNINLNIIKVSNDTLKVETCNTYKFGDSTYSKSGTYTHKYIAKNGCDSFRTLILTSKEVSGKIKLENGIIYTALTPNASYQWYYCYPWRRITNAQYQTFSTTTKGSYAVIVSSLGCTDTSDCVALYSSGIQSLNQNQIQLFPNPIQDNFTIQFGNEYKENSVEIYNALGQKIKSFNTKLNEIQVEMKDESRGIYLIKVNELQVYKIIKE